MATDPAPESSPTTDSVTRWLLIAIGVYSGALVTLLNVVLLGSGSTKDRAIILMADGIIVLWIIVEGSLTPLLRKRLVPRLAAIRMDWRVRFVLFCTLMALIEEAITTSMTNLAPLFGSTPEEAHITASTNYFKVVCFHSVVMFVPMFVAWAWMLFISRISALPRPGLLPRQKGSQIVPVLRSTTGQGFPAVREPASTIICIAVQVRPPSRLHRRTRSTSLQSLPVSPRASQKASTVSRVVTISNGIR